jgi:hypothetical protein
MSRMMSVLRAAVVTSGWGPNAASKPCGFPTRRRLMSQSGFPADVASWPMVLVSGGMNLKAFLGMVARSLQWEGQVLVHLR